MLGPEHDWQVELQMLFGAGKADRIHAFMFYTFRVHQHTDPGTAHKRIAAVVGPEHEDVMLSIADQLIKQGYDKGLEQGFDNGHDKGLANGRAMLLRLLGRRFGDVPAQIIARVTAAAPPALERWFDRALDAASLDDVFDND